MKRLLTNNLLFLALVGSLSAGCSLLNKPASTETNQTNAGAAPATGDSAVAANSPCANIYNPVKDGAVRNYQMSIGKDNAHFVQQYAPGAADFTEEMTLGNTTVKHKWECTAEGLIAGNPASMLTSRETKLEPKHISGVTLPKDSELTVGKTWTAVYETVGKSAGAGEINSQINVTNKVVSMDDDVTVPAGTFKAMKVETVLNMDMKLNGGKIAVPPIKSTTWYAPNIGMIKSGSESLGASMEYTGDK